MADEEAPAAATRKTPTKKPQPKGSLKAYAASPKNGIAAYSPGKRPTAMSRVMAVSPLDDVQNAKMERDVAASGASRPPRATQAPAKAKPKAKGKPKAAKAKPKAAAQADGAGDQSAEADADGSKGAASEQPELTPKEKLGVWAMNNFKAAEAELTLKDEPVTATLKGSLMRTTLEGLGAPLDDELWSEVGDADDKEMEYDVWLKKMKSIGFSASNKSQSGPAGRATLGRTSSVVVPKTAKGKIDFSQVAQLREEITTKRAEEDKKRRQGDLDFAVQQLELVGFNDMKNETSKKHLENTFMAYSSKATAKRAVRQVAKKSEAAK